jgi:hypothetical protein
MKKNNIIIIYLIIFVLNLTMIVVAQDEVQQASGCPINAINPKSKLEEAINRMAKSNTKIDWWSATPEMINHKKCDEKALSLQDIENEIEKKSSAKKGPGPLNIGQVTFSDESTDLTDAFQRLVGKTDLLGKKLPMSDIQAKYHINPECNKVKCAVEKIFGKELGNKLLYINLKSGFNGSELAFDSASRLNTKEVNSLLSAIQAFPSSRFPLVNNQQLTKFKRNYRLASHEEGVVAYAAIAFYDAWTEQSEPLREYTAFHEMGHYIASELNLDSHKAWLGFSGWIEKDGKWTSSKKDSVPSKYAATNPAEDFAESVSAYRYNPQLLKNVNPEKYQFLKETVFDGLEYLQESQCKSIETNSYKLAHDFPSKTQKRTLPEIHLLLKTCGDETKNYLLLGAAAGSRLSSCLANSQNIRSMVASLPKLQPALKYPDLVQNSLERQHPETPPNNQAAADNFQDVKAALKKELITNIFDWEKRNYFYFKGNDVAAVCKDTWSKYGYQAIFTNNDDMRTKLKIYYSTEDFNTLLIKYCEKIHRNQKNLVPASMADIERALGAYP